VTSAIRKTEPLRPFALEKRGRAQLVAPARLRTTRFDDQGIVAIVTLHVPPSQLAVAAPHAICVHTVASQPVGLCLAANAVLYASTFPPLQ